LNLIHHGLLVGSTLGNCKFQSFPPLWLLVRGPKGLGVEL
jgi:hypothetical protein